MPQSKAQKKTMERVMHEFKHGELKGTDGREVTDAKQAVAIGLSESGASDRVTPAQNGRNLARSKRKERRGDTHQQEAEGRDALKPTRTELYAEARRRDVPGRSKMNKAQLERALDR